MGSPEPADSPLASLNIPLASLPLLADTTGLLTVCYGSAGLMLLLGLDVWWSKTKKKNWIRGESFVLGALSLELVGLLYRPIMSISDTQKLNAEIVSHLFDRIYSNQILILGQRVVMCVFVGILLPVVASTPRMNLWSDISALAIQAGGVLIHITYDIYIVVIKNWIDNGHLNYWTVWLLASNILIFVSLGLLVLLLGCAALASTSIQQIVARKITVLLSEPTPGNTGSADLSENKDLSIALEEQAMRSWIAVLTCQPQYIIARSVLISSTGFIVSLCVPFSLLASIKNGYIPVQDRSDWFRMIAIFSQWIFILFGWFIVCWRWITAVVYYPRRVDKMCSGLKEYFRVEDFWKRSLLELQEEFVEWNKESNQRLSYFNRLLFTIVQRLRLYKLFLPFLIDLQILVVLMSKLCWLISEMVFSYHCMRQLLMGQASHGFLGLYNGHSSDPDFQRYSKSLVHMLGENPAGIWVANQKSITALRNRLGKGRDSARSCEALISLLQKRSMEVEEDFNLPKSSAKMTAVSLLTIIMGLSAFYPANGSSHDVDTSTNTSTITVDQATGSSHVGTSINTSTITVEECTKACNEAWKIMELVESMDQEAALVNKEADKVFHSLKQSRKWLGIALPINSPQDTSLGAIIRTLRTLAERGEEMENGGGRNTTQVDSKNWKKVDAGYCLKELCKCIENRPSNTEETLNLIQRSLADVIWNCMYRVDNTIKDMCTDMCRWWADEIMEEKLLEAFELAATVSGVESTLNKPAGTVREARSGHNTFELARRVEK